MSGGAASRVYALLRGLASWLLRPAVRIGSPLVEFARLTLADAYAVVRPVVLFVAAFLNDFVHTVGETEAGWCKCAVSVCLFVPLCVTVTTVAYAVCYYHLVLGNAVVDAPLFFRYDANGAAAQLSAVPLTASNAYSFELALQYPESDHNHALGIVMAGLTVELHRDDAAPLTLLREQRPLMPRYRSPLLRTMTTVASAGPLILGLWHEETHMTHTLTTDWRPADAVAAGQLPTYASLRLAVTFDKPLQLYTSRITVRPRLWGLGYLWTEWFYTTSFLFCWWLVFWQSVIYGALWLCLARCMVDELRASRGTNAADRRFAASDEELLEWDDLLREHRAQRERRNKKAAESAAATATAAAAAASSPADTTDDADDDDDDVRSDASAAASASTSSSAPLDFSSKGLRRRKSRL
jgi:hypothetical protein